MAEGKQTKTRHNRLFQQSVQYRYSTAKLLVIGARTHLLTIFFCSAVTPQDRTVCWYSKKFLLCWPVTRFSLGKHSNRLSLRHNMRLRNRPDGNELL